jgi:hypothetical protein
MKVIKVTNAKIRRLIEEFTAQYTRPDVIIFVNDGAGNFITSVESLEDLRYKVSREDLRTFLRANGINTNIRSIREALQTYGEVIDFIPVPPEI